MFEGCITSFYKINLSCNLNTNKHVVSSLFTSKRKALLETKRAYLFLCIAFRPTVNITCTEQKLEGLTQYQSLRFSFTFLKAYSKAKLKSNRDKVATSFLSFVIGNESDISVLSLLQAS